jgi:hypothetical protein
LTHIRHSFLIALMMHEMAFICWHGQCALFSCFVHKHLVFGLLWIRSFCTEFYASSKLCWNGNRCVSYQDYNLLYTLLYLRFS